MILFTVIIPAVTERLGNTPVLAQLHNQAKCLADPKEVEILVLYDNRQRSLGLKHQILLEAAQGQFIACLDDDDGIADAYLSEITSAIRQNPGVDVIVFNQTSVLNGENPFTVRTGLEYENEEAHRESGLWVNIARKPWHWCCWSARLAKVAKFPDGYIDEDHYWLRQMWPLAQSQYRIDKVLHYYRFNSKTSLAAQGKPTCA